MSTSYDQWLAESCAVLARHGIESARLDCLILLEDELKLDRAVILAHPERQLSVKSVLRLNKKVAQRAQHTPLAYIRNQAFFYGRKFLVGPNVLVPRPESEAIIDLLKESQFGLSPQFIPLRVADVGTGSGCLGITAALEMPVAQLDLYDVDPLALGIAATNAKTHKVKARFNCEDLLASAKNERYDVILANLPYVPNDYPINQAAGHEPHIALFGGVDGLDLYRRFWQQISTLVWQPQYILTESLTSQHQALSRLARKVGYKLLHTKGLVQQFSPINLQGRPTK